MLPGVSRGIFRAMPGDLLSTREASRLLNVSERTMRRWIRQGLFGATDSAGGIERGALRRWAREHGLSIETHRREQPKPVADLLADAVQRGAVTSGCAPKSAVEAIAIAIGAVPGLSDEERGELRGEILERERMASTGLGHGVALPHPRKPPAHLFTEPVISVCFPDQPLDWAALDGEPVTCVMLLLSPSAPVHLQILSRVAFALRRPEFQNLLRERPTREQLVEHLRGLRKDG